MKIAYNPSGASPLVEAPKNNNDIIFDLAGKAIYVKDVKLLGTDTVYDVFKKPTSSNEGGNVGLVPVPSYTNTNTRFLREDGTWVVPTNTTYSVFTGSTLENSGKAGLVPAPSTGFQRLLLSDGTWTLKFLSYDIPANSAIKITFYGQTHATLFMRHTWSDNMGVYHISGYGAYGDTKRISIVEVTNSCSGIIYPVDGEFAIIIKNPETTNRLFVSITLLLGSISKIETVTSEVTKSDIWRNVLHSANAFIKNGTININGVSITPLTQHLSLSNYVTLDTALVITGYKDFTRQVKISTAGNPLILASSTTYCDIGFVITNSDGTTVGSGIVLRGNADFKIYDIGWSNEYTILHSNNYTLYKHAYTNLTGSGTIANLAIVSTGTTNGWTLKTLGSNAFDSTKYLPLTGGTLSGDLNFSHLSSNVKGHITWTGGTVLQRIQISDNNSPNDAVFIFLLSANSGTDWTDLFTIKDNGSVVATTFLGNATSSTKLQTSRTIWGQSFDGTADVTGHLYIPNNSYLHSYTTAGTAVTLLSVDTANLVNFAYGAAVQGLTSYINGNIIVFRYGTGHVEALRIDSSGNVGIGITSPTQKLHVLGNVAATSFIGNLDWSYITNKPTSFTPSAHTHTTKQITACTDYAMASQRGNVSTEDSLNTALGKIEYKALLGVTAYDWYKSITNDDTDDIINKWGEIVGFLDSVKEGTDILDEFVTRKTDLVITGKKTFYGDGSAIVTVKRNHESHPTYVHFADENESLGFIGISKEHRPVFYHEQQYTILHAGNSYIKNGVITINGASITPLTLHLSLANYVTLDTYLKITGLKLFNTSSNTLPLLISRTGSDGSEVLKIGIDDHNATFEFINDEVSNSFLFKLVNTDTEGSDGSNANSSLVKFYGGAGGSVVIADKFMGQLDKTLTFAAGAFIAKTYHNSTAVTVNIPTHTSHLTNNSGFLTQHQSLANYVTLDGAQTITGAKTFTQALVTNSYVGGTKLRFATNSSSRWDYLYILNSSCYTTQSSPTTHDFIVKTGLPISAHRKYYLELKGDLYSGGNTFNLIISFYMYNSGIHQFRVSGFTTCPTSTHIATYIENNIEKIAIYVKNENSSNVLQHFITLNLYKHSKDDPDFTIINATTSDINSLTIKSSINNTSNLYLGDINTSKIKLIGGTASQFLKGDGSIDSNTYATTTLLGLYLPLTGGTLNGPLTIAPINTSGAQEGLILQDTGNGLGERLNIKWISRTYGPVALRPNHDYTQLLFYNGTSDYTLLHSGNYSSYLPILNSASTHATNASVIYAPSTAGTYGQVLVSTGSGAPVWKSATLITAAPVEYGLLNLCVRVAAGSLTSVTNNVLTTSGVDYDTYFKLILSEPLEVDQYYTLGFYVENVPLSATLWSFGVGNQSNTNWIINITSNGWVWATGYYNNNGNSLELLIDDVSRNFYNSIKISKIVLVKGKLKAYYSPAPINLSNYTSYLGYVGTTKVQASSAAQALTGITSATITGVTNTNTLTISNTSGVGHINFSRGSYNYITMPSGGLLHILPNGVSASSSNGMVFSSKGLHPATNSAYSLGTSSLKWSLVYTLELVSASCQSTFIELNLAGGIPKYGGFIDFHFHNSEGKPTDNLGNVVETTPDYTSRIIENAAGTLYINGTTFKNGYVASKGFMKLGSSDSYILLGGGSHKAVSDFLLKSELENLELNSNLYKKDISLKPTTLWADVGDLGTLFTNPHPGTYAILVYCPQHKEGTSARYHVFYSGIISINDNTNTTDTSDEIWLHASAHASHIRIYLRTITLTKTTTLTGANYPKLLIAASANFAEAVTFNFKIKRLI